MENLVAAFSKRDLVVATNVWLHLKNNNASMEDLSVWLKTQTHTDVKDSKSKPARPWDFLDPRTMYASTEDAKVRFELCNSCDHMMITGQCTKCGCFMRLKTKLAHAKCPIGKWVQVDGNKLFEKKEQARVTKPKFCQRCGFRLLFSSVNDKRLGNVRSVIRCGNVKCDYVEYSDKTVRELLNERA